MNNIEAFEAMKQVKKVFAKYETRKYKFIELCENIIIDDKMNFYPKFFAEHSHYKYEVYEELKKKITLYRAKVYRNKSGCLFTSSSWEYYQKFDEEVLEWETTEVEVDE